ncbi:Voltage-gated ClC-type chloride channel clcB, partial [Yersinia bercovieri ATCC 43970]
MKRPAHIYYYRAMLRRLLISIMLGMMAALIVWLFHQAMLGLEWL